MKSVRVSKELKKVVQDVKEEELMRCGKIGLILRTGVAAMDWGSFMYQCTVNFRLLVPSQKNKEPN